MKERHASLSQAMLPLPQESERASRVPASLSPPRGSWQHPSTRTLGGVLPPSASAFESPWGEDESSCLSGALQVLDCAGVENRMSPGTQIHACA